jgi:hypothetical protein
MGHGPDEAALGVHLRVAWRTLLLAGTPDDRILPTLEELLRAEQETAHPRYVTACDITVGDGRIGVRVAGHPAPIVTDAAAPSSPDARYPDLAIGPPLGVRIPDRPAGASWPTTDLPLPGTGSVLLYTDGLLDAYAADPGTGGLGITELVDAVRRCASEGSSADVWLPNLVGRAPREAIDDTAAVVLTVTGRR